MALQHPHVLVLGIDFVLPTVHKARIPPNCQFSIHDINLGLFKYYNMFDVVHMRNISTGAGPVGVRIQFFLPLP